MPVFPNRLIALPLALVLAFLTSCGDVPREVQVRPTPSTAKGVPVVQDVKIVDRATELAEISRVARDVRKVGDAVRAETVRKAAFVIAVSKIPTVRIGEGARVATHGAWTATGGGAPCDGDLPPCWRIIGTESGGRWDAYNPGGCVEHGVVYGCWGPYQFSGSWAGKLGLPNDLRTTTKEQWVSAARQLWNGGRGCSNWSAC